MSVRYATCAVVFKEIAEKIYPSLREEEAQAIGIAFATLYAVRKKRGWVKPSSPQPQGERKENEPVDVPCLIIEGEKVSIYPHPLGGCVAQIYSIKGHSSKFKQILQEVPPEVLGEIKELVSEITPQMETLKTKKSAVFKTYYIPVREKFAL